MHQAQPETRPQYRPIIVINEGETVKIVRPDQTAPRLYFDQGSAEQALRADWPGAEVRSVGGRIMHMRVLSSLVQVRDLLETCAKSAQDVGALDLAVVVTHTTTVEDTLLVSVLGAFLREALVPHYFRS